MIQNFDVFLWGRKVLFEQSHTLEEEIKKQLGSIGYKF